jgi:uncharacterized repeat protein (TIGR01451 family)
MIEEVDRAIAPFITADYGKWEITPFAPVRVDLATRIAQEQTPENTTPSALIVAFEPSTTASPTPEPPTATIAQPTAQVTFPSATPVVSTLAVTAPTLEISPTLTVTVTETVTSSPTLTPSPTVIPATPPLAVFSASPNIGNAPLTVTFTNLSSGSITGYGWNFGDGGTSSERAPVYVYTNPGVYVVTLTVSGKGGNNTATAVITVNQVMAPISTPIISAPQTNTPVPSLPTQAPTVLPTTPTPLQVDLSLQNSVDNPTPFEGDTVTFTLALRNNSSAAAYEIAVSDTLPGGLTFLSSFVSQGSYSGSTWNVGTLTGGATASLTISARVNTGTNGQTLIRTASIIRSSAADPNTGNNTSSVTLQVQRRQTDLALSMTTSSRTPFENTTVTFTLRLSNNGAHAATGVRITDLLPPELTYLSHNISTGSYNAGSGVWQIDTLNQGASVTMTLDARVNSAALGKTVTNTASLTALDQQDSNPTNNRASIDLRVPLNCATNSEPNIGAANGIFCVVRLPGLVIDLGSKPIVTGAGYDLVYYEIPLDSNPSVIHLDEVIVEVATSASGPWLEVFNWGDGIPDTNTNLSGTQYGANEQDNLAIPSTNPPLWGNTPFITGIAIDVDGRVAPGVYRWVRIRTPNSSSIDAVEPLPP